MGVDFRGAWFGKGAQPLGWETVRLVCRVGAAGTMAEGGAGPTRIALNPSATSPSSHRFIYELEHFNGVAELLEILGR